VVKLFLRHPCTPSCIWFTERIQTIHHRIPGSSNLTLSGCRNRVNSTSMCWITTPVRNFKLGSKISGLTRGVWTFPKNWSRSSTRVGTGGALTPYQIYLNMAYHLSQEARAGLSEFKVPRISAINCSVSNRGSKDRCSLPKQTRWRCD